MSDLKFILVGIYILLAARSSWNNSSASLLKIKVLSSWIPRILVCRLTFWLHTEFVSGSKDKYLVSLAMKWTSKNCFSTMQLLFLRIEREREFTSHLNILHRGLPFSSVVKRHKKSFALCYKVRERMQKTQAMCTGCRRVMVCCSRVVRLAMSPAGEVQHKLKWCKCFAVDLRDSTSLLKLAESSPVHTRAVWNTNYFPQSGLHSIHFILLRRMMCSIDPAVKSRSHFGLP